MNTVFKGLCDEFQNFGHCSFFFSFFWGEGVGGLYIIKIKGKYAEITADIWAAIKTYSPQLDNWICKQAHGVTWHQACLGLGQFRVVIFGSFESKEMSRKGGFVC